MADDQGTSFAPGKQERRVTRCRKRHGPVERQRAAEPVSPGRERDRSRSIDQALKVVTRLGGRLSRLGQRGPLARVAASPGKVTIELCPSAAISLSVIVLLLSSRYGGKNTSIVFRSACGLITNGKAEVSARRTHRHLLGRPTHPAASC